MVDSDEENPQNFGMCHHGNFSDCFQCKEEQELLAKKQEVESADDSIPESMAENDKENPETARERLHAIRQELLAVLERKDIASANINLDVAIDQWSALEEQDQVASTETVQWLENNNNRINLYQVAGISSENWDNEPMTDERASRLLALKKLDLSIKVMSEIDDIDAAVSKLDGVVRDNFDNSRISTAVIDTLARLGQPGTSALERIIDDDAVPQTIRLSAALSTLRYGNKDTALEEKIIKILDQGVSADDHAGMTSAIELAGLIGGDAGRRTLDMVHEKMNEWPVEKRIWFERDLISTRLTIDQTYKESIAIDLGGRCWVSDQGIVFGSIKSEGDFDEFVQRNRARLEKIAISLEKINTAFGSEPVMYVDLEMEKSNGDGWTANSVYADAEMIGHPRITDVVNVQGLGHEACERWESKGFVDAEMERQYLQMMSDEYDGSTLDKFRLNHRMDVPTKSGHPWDGTREYMAEVGSTLLVDPDAGEHLFDHSKDRAAFDALGYLKSRLSSYRERHRK